MIMSENGKLIKQYFQNKTDKLIAISKQAICEHSVLKGSHREDLIKIYLIEVLSQQVVLVEGMIYFDEYIAKELEDIDYTQKEYCQYRPNTGFKHVVFSK